MLAELIASQKDYGFVIGAIVFMVVCVLGLLLGAGMVWRFVHCHSRRRAHWLLLPGAPAAAAAAAGAAGHVAKQQACRVSFPSSWASLLYPTKRMHDASKLP